MEEDFYTYSKVIFFLVNRRLVYAMKSVGCGASSAERFYALMNMPPIARSTLYSSHNKGHISQSVLLCFI